MEKNEKEYSSGTNEESGNPDYDTLSVSDFDGVEGTVIDTVYDWVLKIIWLLFAMVIGAVLGMIFL